MPVLKFWVISDVNMKGQRKSTLGRHRASIFKSFIYLFKYHCILCACCVCGCECAIKCVRVGGGVWGPGKHLWQKKQCELNTKTGFTEDPLCQDWWCASSHSPWGCAEWVEAKLGLGEGNGDSMTYKMCHQEIPGKVRECFNFMRFAQNQWKLARLDRYLRLKQESKKEISENFDFYLVKLRS